MANKLARLTKSFHTVPLSSDPILRHLHPHLHRLCRSGLLISHSSRCCPSTNYFLLSLQNSKTVSAIYKGHTFVAFKLEEKYRNLRHVYNVKWCCRKGLQTISEKIISLVGTAANCYDDRLTLLTEHLKETSTFIPEITKPLQYLSFV